MSSPQQKFSWKHCFHPKVLIGLGVVAVLLFFILPGKAQAGSFLPILLALACPLSMLFMIKGMWGASCEPDHERKALHNQTHTPEQGLSENHSGHRVLFTCPECSLSYCEAHWAEECAAWCKEHKSCNLAITQHAVQRKN